MRFLWGILLSAFVTSAAFCQETLIVTGPNFQQMGASEIQIDVNGTQKYLGAALAAAGCSSNCNFAGTTTLSGPTNSAGINDSGGINTTSLLGYQYNGANMLRTTSATVVPALLGGPGTGASLPAGAQFLVSFGPHNMESDTATTGESTTFGMGVGIMAITNNINGFGDSVCSGARTGACTGFGNDAMRDTDDIGGSVAVGSGAYEDGNHNTSPNIVVGTDSLPGAQSTFTVGGGTPVVGQTWSFPFSTSNPCGGAVTINCTTMPQGSGATTRTYTVTSADTTSAILAGHIATALTGNYFSYTLNDGVVMNTVAVINVSFQVSDPTRNPTVIKGHYLAGWNIVPGTPTCVASGGGACSGAGETMTVGPGFTGGGNIVIGPYLAGSPLATTLQKNIFISGATPQSFLTTAANDDIIGYGAAPLISSASNVNALGDTTLPSLSTGSRFSVLGSGVGGVCATGTNVMLLGTNPSTQCGSAAESNAIHIGAGAADIISVTGAGTPATSVTALAGELDIGGAVKIDGTAGVTCSAGLPTASFQVSNGIVVHC